MKKLLRTVFFMLLVMSAGRSWAGEVKVDLDPAKLTEVPNAVTLDENLVAGGTPTARGLGQAAEQGVRTVIDVREPEEGTAKEKDNADAVGLRYVNIPISLKNFSPEQADKLNAVLKDPATGPALLHCASGQRAVAVWTLHRNLNEGVPAAQALEEGKAKGLKKPELVEKLQTLLK